MHAFVLRIIKTAGSGLAVLLLVFLGNSCVSNRQITFLQYEDELVSPEKILSDSIIRRYETGELRYKLQPDDILSIRIASTTPDEYNPFSLADPYLASGGMQGNISSQGAVGIMGYRVDPFGYLTLPILGKVEASGYSIEELEDIIDSLASYQLETPVSKINLLNFKYTVLGEVMGEGVQVSEENYMTMLQALASAGGPDEFGDLEHVKVIRKVGNETYVFYVNLLDESFLTSDFYYVFPNDIIIVPPLKSRIYFKYITSNIAIVSSVMSFAASVVALLVVFGGGNP